MTKITQAFADLATAVNIDSSTFRIRSTGAGIEIEIGTLVTFKDYAEATVTINPQALTTAKRITQASASIEAAASVLANLTNQLKAQASVETEIATQFDDVRYRIESSGVDISANIIAENDRLRYSNVEVEIDATSDLNANAIFSASTDTQIAVDVISLLYQWAKASSEISVDVESIASRVLSGEASVEVELGLEADGTKTWIVMVFESLTAGDTMNIDTEELNNSGSKWQ